MLDLQRFRRDHRIKQRELQEILKVSQPYISQIESFEKPLPDALYNLLLAKYGNTLEKYKITDKTIRTHEEGTGVPYYDIDVTATISMAYGDFDQTPEFYVDFKPFNDCTAYLPVFGNSMYPDLNNGEVIAVKKLINPEIILWGEPHLVITNDEANNMRTVKLLFPHEDTSRIILRSSNPAYQGDTILNKSSIIGLYIVKGKITRMQL